MNDDTNHLIDPPADVAMPEPAIDADACADWLRGADRDWWADLDLPEYTDETPFQQALRITYTSSR